MSHGKLREEKDCLNCGHLVEEKYCPNCGQQNIQTRQPFYYLFTHFVEDFTHYDGQFWGTIKNLLFKPGKLTNTYLEGKRQKFVPPVKLYIFISFITFFLFALFPPFDINFEGKGKSKLLPEKNKITEIQKALEETRSKEKLEEKDSIYISKLNAALKDSAKINELQGTFDMSKGMSEDSEFNGFTNRKSYDSAVAKNPSFFDFINTPFAHKYFELKEQGVKKGEILKKLYETSFHNLPKALFIYLPIFALFLWIFHNKKKWWYFDHGIFTLHYFSFLLLNILIFTFLNKLTDVINISFINGIIYFVMTLMVFYSVIYFFIAHYKVYNSHGIVSFIIGTVLFTINFFAFLFLVAGLGVISFLMIH
ncbi:DUF3667 domain-containing protein [Epilithonimonas mollis]|uniref:DUF3667 domain-containing protein n=1 Tax=Epilithonimonas mollis TaxID=216903 RepID=A0A1M6RP12_9FLAO|nr:DUF3667 domain-containing protein [Epilithonimonas mollis]SHK34206.1 Protein of unknown function [Epilithonimonas mollis]